MNENGVIGGDPEEMKQALAQMGDGDSRENQNDQPEERAESLARSAEKKGLGIISPRSKEGSRRGSRVRISDEKSGGSLVRPGQEEDSEYQEEIQDEYPQDEGILMNDNSAEILLTGSGNEEGLYESQDSNMPNARATGIPGPYKLFDFIFPGGKVASLCRIEKMIDFEDAAMESTLKKFKFSRPNPVVVLTGARDSGRQNFLEGVSRAAFRSDAVIVDSGTKNGIERSVLRQNLKLIGVFPNEQISLPVLGGKTELPDQLTNGHSHMFMITDKLYQKWGNEAKLKMKIAERYFFFRSNPT